MEEVCRAETKAVLHYRSGAILRSRSVSNTVLSGVVNIPAPPARLVADWQREISLNLGLQTGDVEALPLPRARMRWPQYKDCVQAARDWTSAMGLQDVLATSDIALMACRGASYHHDATQYGSSAFCNLFLSEDRGLDVHFAAAGHRIPLVRGTVIVFDTGQPHAVINRRSTGFDAADFLPEVDCTQVFLTWELPIENVNVAQALGIVFGTQCDKSLHVDEGQVWVNGRSATVCPRSGRWL